MANSLPKLKLANEASPEPNDNLSKKLNYLLERELSSTPDPSGFKIVKMKKAPLKVESINKKPISGRTFSPKQNRERNYQLQIDFLDIASQLQEEANKKERVTRKKSVICSKMLELLSEEHVNFKTEILLLKREVDQYLFCIFDDIIDKLLKFVKKPFLEKYITYYDAVILLLKEMEMVSAEKKQATDDKERTIKEKNLEVDKMKRELEDMALKYKNSDVDFRTRHIRETEAFENKIDDLNTTVNQYESIMFDQNQKLTILKENTAKTISELQDKYQLDLIEYKEIIKKLEENLESRKHELREMKVYLDKVTHDQTNAVISLKICKDKIEQLENTIQKMASENLILAKRAAVSFENLTPRPKLEKFWALAETNMTDRKKTTVDALDIIYTKLAEDKDTLHKENINLKKFIKKRTMKDPSIGGDTNFLKKAAYLRDTSRKLKNTLILKHNYQARGSIMVKNSIQSNKQGGTNESLADILDSEPSLDELDEQK